MRFLRVRGTKGPCAAQTALQVLGHGTECVSEPVRKPALIDAGRKGTGTWLRKQNPRKPKSPVSNSVWRESEAKLTGSRQPFEFECLACLKSFLSVSKPNPPIECPFCKVRLVDDVPAVKEIAPLAFDGE